MRTHKINYKFISSSFLKNGIREHELYFFFINIFRKAFVFHANFNKTKGSRNLLRVRTILDIFVLIMALYNYTFF